MFEQSLYGQLNPQSGWGSLMGLGSQLGGFGSFGSYPQTGGGYGSVGSVGGFNPMFSQIGNYPPIDPLTAAYLQQLITTQHMSPFSQISPFGQSQLGQGSPFSQISPFGQPQLGQGSPFGQISPFGQPQLGQGSPFGQISPFGQTSPYGQTPFSQIHPQHLQALVHLQTLASQYQNPLTALTQQSRLPYGISPFGQQFPPQQLGAGVSNWPFNIRSQPYGQIGGIGSGQVQNPFQTGMWGYGTGLY